MFFGPGYKMSFSKLRGSSLLKSVTSRYHPTTYCSLFRPVIYSFMTKTPSTSPQSHLQQIQKQFSTSSSKMSQSNNNFLLSEVFNVKGKVGCSHHWWWKWYRPHGNPRLACFLLLMSLTCSRNKRNMLNNSYSYSLEKSWD